MNWSIIAQKVRRTVSPIPPLRYWRTGAGRASNRKYVPAHYWRTTGALAQPNMDAVPFLQTIPFYNEHQRKAHHENAIN